MGKQLHTHPIEWKSIWLRRVGENWTTDVTVIKVISFPSILTPRNCEAIFLNATFTGFNEPPSSRRLCAFPSPKLPLAGRSGRFRKETALCHRTPYASTYISRQLRNDNCCGFPLKWGNPLFLHKWGVENYHKTKPISDLMLYSTRALENSELSYNLNIWI